MLSKKKILTILAFEGNSFFNELDNIFVLKFNKNSYLSKTTNIFFPIIAKKAEINFIENTDNFSDQDWQSLYKLSENTFVEENESLKKGAAGAGLTDND